MLTNTTQCYLYNKRLISCALNVGQAADQWQELQICQDYRGFSDEAQPIFSFTTNIFYPVKSPSH